MHLNMSAVQKITPFLWFDSQADEALEFYTSLFPDSRIVSVNRYPDGPSKGNVLTAVFELFGQRFMAIDGGPMFSFTEAISMHVDCETQEEVDRYWEALIDGGKELMCGWCTDRYGLSWQIIPRRLYELLQDTDPARAKRATDAMLKMRKIDVAVLEAAVREN
ncbi:MAG: VOC family protein [Rhodothermales bacterium]